jgi:hypothetical protein
MFNYQFFITSSICELLIEYDSFDPNHIVIIYEEMDGKLNCYKINHETFYFECDFILNNGIFHYE